MDTKEYDGFFSIIEKPEGYYIEVSEQKEGVEAIDIEDVKDALAKKGVHDFDIDAVKEALENAKETEMIPINLNTVNNELNVEKEYKIEVTEDRMKAYIMFYPSDCAQTKQYEAEDFQRELRAKNVIHGINAELIEEICRSREVGKDYIIAEGDYPVDPVVGYVDYKFKTTNDYKPEVDEDGNVNFKKLSIISSVKEGDLLAEIVPHIEGQEGKNLSGVTIQAKKTKPLRIKYGKNTKISEEKTQLFAGADGLVKVIDGKIIVYDVFEVPNHVGNSTGDIDFNGSVVVHGNIITGFTVKAAGDVEVNGVVEGATIIAGGNIVLHRGIQGMGKSHIECGGDLQTKFIEQANVEVKGDIHSEAVLHSTVRCKGSVIVEGKKGMVSGGKVLAGVSVESKILGSHMGTKTDIEVGIDPMLLETFNELRKELPKLEEEADKLEKVITLLNKRKEIEGALDPEKAEMYKSAVRNKIFLMNTINTSKKKVEELEEEVANRHSGIVKVAGELYPGVKVGIGNVFYNVREELKFVSMRKEGAEIRLSSL